MVMSPKFVFDIFLLEHYAPDVHSNNYIEVGLQRATSQMLQLKGDCDLYKNNSTLC